MQADAESVRGLDFMCFTGTNLTSTGG